MKTVMLRRGWMVIFAFVMVTALSITITKAQGRVSLQVFYDELQPYGTWMDYGSHGYVWIPAVDRSFVPYATNGYWINTEYGNTWVSDYAWGWAPFHYGRWLFDDFYGWLWVPDTQWAPAWVAWRSGGGYYGWAPLMPGMGIHASFHMYNGFPAHYWNFVPYRYITYRRVHNHCAPRVQVVNIINHTTIITHNHTDHRRHRYFTGPTRTEIERRGGGRVTVHTISESDRPGRTEVSRSTANFYRPEVDHSRDSRSRAVPSSFVKKDGDGTLEKVEAVRNGSNDVYSYRRTKLNQNDAPVIQRNNASNFQQESSRKPEHMQQRTYEPKQRTTERLNTQRSYERLPQENQPAIQRRYEAPRMDSREDNRERQQQSNAYNRPSRQAQVQQRSGQPNYQQNSLRPNGTRSSMRQSQQPAQVQKRESGSGYRTPAQTKNGHSVFRKSN